MTNCKVLVKMTVLVDWTRAYARAQFLYRRDREGVCFRGFC